jgi:hypothetical protein
MKIINSELTPIMIATEGLDFYDKNNTEKAADHTLIRLQSDIIAVLRQGFQREPVKFLWSNHVHNAACTFLDAPRLGRVSEG